MRFWWWHQKKHAVLVRHPVLVVTSHFFSVLVVTFSLHLWWWQKIIHMWWWQAQTEPHLVVTKRSRQWKCSKMVVTCAVLVVTCAVLVVNTPDMVVTKVVLVVNESEMVVTCALSVVTMPKIEVCETSVWWVSTRTFVAAIKRTRAFELALGATRAAQVELLWPRDTGAKSPLVHLVIGHDGREEGALRWRFVSRKEEQGPGLHDRQRHWKARPLCCAELHGLLVLPQLACLFGRTAAIRFCLELLHGERWNITLVNKLRLVVV